MNLTSNNNSRWADHSNGPLEAGANKELLFEVRGISKAFAGVQALKNVSLSVRGGEVHALIGENGAGKLKSISRRSTTGSTRASRSKN